MNKKSNKIILGIGTNFLMAFRDFYKWSTFKGFKPMICFAKDKGFFVNITFNKNQLAKKYTCLEIILE